MSLNDQLNQILNDLQAVWLESTLMLGAVMVLIVGLFSSKAILLWLTFALVMIGGFVAYQGGTLSGEVMLGSIFISEDFRPFSGLLVCSSLLLLVFGREKHATEFYFLLLSMLIGSLFMIKANNLLIVYLSVELASFAGYILTNFSFERRSFEAGIKYLLFGAISSSIMLFGMALLYGSTGTIYLSEWDATFFNNWVTQTAMIMMFLGLFFKISIFPSHLWVPTTYQTAPIDATAYMSVIPKLAALVLLKRFFSLGLIRTDDLVFQVIVFSGIVTLIVGTLGAFIQSNARRMVSFGAIAHSGFLLPFVFVQSDTSLDSFWFYSCIYILMNFAVFYIIDAYEKKGIHSINSYELSQSNVLLGVALMFILISLVGIPPLAGFTSKFLLFSTIWEFYEITEISSVLWYLVVAILIAVGSLFFYLRIPKKVFLSKPKDNPPIDFSFSTKIWATLFCIALLILFFVPDLVMKAKYLLNINHE